MIVVHQPYVYQTKSKSRLECEITDDKMNKTYKIWYEVDDSYKEYLCTELSDAFLIAVLPRAVFTEQDIHIEGNVSPKLLYNTREMHIPLLTKLYGKHLMITVTTERSQAVNFAGCAVATGCSLGIDSLSTIYQHIDPKCPQEYRLTHLALFNSSQFGDKNQDRLDKALEEAAKKAKVFADEVGLPLLVINTNVNELVVDLSLTGTQAIGYFTISCPMALQKMFKQYLLASSISAESVEFTDIECTENLYVPLLGNENVDISISQPFLKRIEKTIFVCENPLTPKYLDVCWATESANSKDGVSWYLDGKKNRNCGWCDKCARTLFTLELLGKVSEYKEAFDMDKWQKYRSQFIVKVVANVNRHVHYRELYDLMVKKGYHIPVIGIFLQKTNFQDSKIFKQLYSFIRGRIRS